MRQGQTARTVWPRSRGFARDSAANDDKTAAANESAARNCRNLCTLQPLHLQREFNISGRQSSRGEL